MLKHVTHQQEQKEDQAMTEVLQAIGKVLLVAAIGGGVLFGMRTLANHFSGRKKPTKQIPAPVTPKTAESSRSPAQDPKVRQLAQELAALKRELEWLNSLDEHSRLLYSLFGPIQVLIGCADAAPGLSENQRRYFLDLRALQPLAAAAERFSRLPQSAPAPAAVSKADVEAYLKTPAGELQRRVQEWKRRVRAKDYLRRDYELLLALEEAGLFRLSEAEAAAAGEKAAALLREHGIFPLYRDEVKDQPDLWDSFNEGSSVMTACPGLFLRRDGRYELLAAYNGIWVRANEG